MENYQWTNSQIQPSSMKTTPDNEGGGGGGENPNELHIVAPLQRTNKEIDTAIQILNSEGKERTVSLRAMGRAINRTIGIAEIIKRHVPDLHQITKLDSSTVVDHFEPLVQGMEPKSVTRAVSAITIILSKEPLDANNPGYQTPMEATFIQSEQQRHLADLAKSGGQPPEDVLNRGLNNNNARGGGGGRRQRQRRAPGFGARRRQLGGAIGQNQQQPQTGTAGDGRRRLGGRRWGRRLGRRLNAGTSASAADTTNPTQNVPTQQQAPLTANQPASGGGGRPPTGTQRTPARNTPGRNRNNNNNQQQPQPQTSTVTGPSPQRQLFPQSGSSGSLGRRRRRVGGQQQQPISNTQAQPTPPRNLNARGGGMRSGGLVGGYGRGGFRRRMSGNLGNLGPAIAAY